MKGYNIKNLEAGLCEIAQQIKGHEINKLAVLEMLDPSTVRIYLKGKVTTPAVGKAILDRARKIIIDREQQVAA